MKIDVNDELKNVQRPRKLRKAIMVTALILINDLAIFIAASLLLRRLLRLRGCPANPCRSLAHQLQSQLNLTRRPELEITAVRVRVQFTRHFSTTHG